jgi:hypothetical protein
MVSTLPTKVVLYLARHFKLIVDDISAIKSGLFNVVSVAGTTFIPMIINAANYSVPAATNFHIYTIPPFQGNVGTITVFQLGYADDVIGTNFVLLYDLLFLLTNSLIQGDEFYPAFLGDLVVPATKFPLIKVTDTVTTDAVGLMITGIQTA